jgi:hypothetical protein
LGLYSRAKGKSPILVVTNRLNQRYQSRSRSSITFDCFPRYLKKRENDFVRVAQNRFHKKTVCTALPKAKTAFQQTEASFL